MRFLSSLLLTLIGVDTATYFTANGTLFCGMDKTRCYYVSMTEVDSFAVFNDKIDFSGVHCVKKEKSEFEIKMRKRKVVRPIVSESVYKSLVHYEWNVEVEEKEDVVSEYW
ncbi:hypothetical protein GCK72_015505 [Caenorhabditis remanei]|uniref:Uncharacterized protein n=1 Tax=Caenorhabditis remanei TaxID=31234 RepID=A0A6A5GX12_CAERE|nr:hypothetical protein GCK72_015505 [Caenorhabditis remanei]KAF1759045.1 hypothetical protein GCK72_015505 [Caenorhabditis remanei]